MTGSPISTGSPSKRRRRSGPASPTPWCTSFTSCRTLPCSGSSTRSTGTGRRSTATRASRTCSASWPSADRACSRPTSSNCGSNTPRSRRCPTRRRPLRRRRPLPPAAPLPGAVRRPGPPPRPQPLPPGPGPPRPGAPGRPRGQAAGNPEASAVAPGPAAAPRPAPDEQRPDQQRPDQQRPDQRQVPSAGRRYRGLAAEMRTGGAGPAWRGTDHVAGAAGLSPV